MNILYITARTPLGKGEEFILPEVKEMIELGQNVTIAPVKPKKNFIRLPQNEYAYRRTVNKEFIDLQLILEFVKGILLNPKQMIRLQWKILTESKGIKHKLKNLSVFPKAVYLAKYAEENNIEFIHAHWLSTSATVAYIINALTGKEYAITCHRWDIWDANMIYEKLRTAKFIRVISKSGYNKILSYCNNNDKNINKIIKIHCGVKLNVADKVKKIDRKNNEIKLVVPANIVEVKGHKYLIEAINLLKDKYSIVCHCYGDGELLEDLKSKVKSFGLENNIIFKGRINNNELFKMYKEGYYDCLVLPSIVTDKGEQEGIPVSLMEAMINRVMVISTNTGGITELLDASDGISVSKEKDSKDLAEKIERFILSYNRDEIIEKNYNKVIDKFNIGIVSKKIINLIKGGDLSGR